MTKNRHLRGRGFYMALAVSVALAAGACTSSAASTSAPSAAAPTQASSTSAVPSTAAQASGTAMATVRLVNTKYDAELLPITAGLQRGTFKQYGINLQVTTAKTSSLATSALVSGRADLGLMQAAFVVNADAAGANLVMVEEVLDQLDYQIITAKGITSLSQLAGKKMADPGPNNGNTAVMKAVMDAAGIGSNNLTYVTVGVQNAILAAIEKNQAQVGLLVDPFAIQARAAGLNDLGLVTKYLPNNTAAVIAGLKTTLQKEPTVVQHFLQALIASTTWVKTHPTQAIAMLEKTSSISASDATQSYNDVKAIYSTTGQINGAAMQTWIQDSVKYGVLKSAIPASEVYTNQYLPGQ